MQERQRLAREKEEREEREREVSYLARLTGACAIVLITAWRPDPFPWAPQEKRQEAERLRKAREEEEVRGGTHLFRPCVGPL